MGEVIEHESTPARMLMLAIEKGTSLDQLEKLLDLQQRWEANEARKAFVRAMNAFKADPPSIFKDRQVNIPGGAKFSHASLAQVVDAVIPALSQHGLTHRWESKQNGIISVTCIITHELGHSESVTLSAPADDSGKKNGIQQIASTVTYLQRYTLMAATGLAARDQDDDARSAGVEFVTAKQVADLDALIEEVKADKPRLLEWLQVDSLSDLPAANYTRAVRALEKKRTA